MAGNSTDALFDLLRTVDAGVQSVTLLVGVSLSVVAVRHFRLKNGRFSCSAQPAFLIAMTFAVLVNVIVFATPRSLVGDDAHRVFQRVSRILYFHVVSLIVYFLLARHFFSRRRELARRARGLLIFINITALVAFIVLNAVLLTGTLSDSETVLIILSFFQFDDIVIFCTLLALALQIRRYMRSFPFGSAASRAKVSRRVSRYHGVFCVLYLVRIAYTSYELYILAMGHDLDDQPLTLIAYFTCLLFVQEVLSLGMLVYMRVRRPQQKEGRSSTLNEALIAADAEASKQQQAMYNAANAMDDVAMDPQTRYSSNVSNSSAQQQERLEQEKIEHQRLVQEQLRSARQQRQQRESRPVVVAPLRLAVNPQHQRIVAAAVAPPDDDPTTASSPSSFEWESPRSSSPTGASSSASAVPTTATTPSSPGPVAAARPVTP